MDTLERWVRWIGAAGAAVTLGAVLVGLVQAQFRQRGRSTGQAARMLRVPVYLVLAVLYFGSIYLLWRPLPVLASNPLRIAALVLGSLLLLPGLTLTLWARLTLGRMYNVSSAVGAQLYADHRLITHGPFSVIRHPMYAGILAASLGGLLVYRTWSLVFTTITLLGLSIRARREEQALAAEFGEAWLEYSRRVPGWLPRLRRR